MLLSLFTVSLLLLAAATVDSEATSERLDKDEVSKPKAYLLNDSSHDESGAKAEMDAAMRSSDSRGDLTHQSAAVIAANVQSVWPTTTISSSSPTCAVDATESSRMTAVLGTALLIPCPLLNRTANFASIAWTHTPTGWTISRHANERVPPSLTRRIFFAKDGTSLVVVAVRETDAFQCTMFVSDDECRSAIVSLDVQQCQSPEMNPCANGGNCSIVLPTTPVASVDCLCVYGYRGSRCEDEISRGVWLIVLFWVFIVLEVALVFAGAYRFLQLRRMKTESAEDEDIPVYKLLSMISVVEASAA
uniref:EGF-like domain-containing protein n=1 Tax=Plectus sambesii TaxID=2011161 RepID=A0A914WIF6_9BILA